MPRIVPLALAILSAGAIVGGLLWRLAAPQATPATAGPPATTARNEPDSPPSAAPPEPAPSAEVVAGIPAGGAEALASYERTLAVQGEIAAFLEAAERLPKDERARRAAALAGRIDELEAARIAIGAQAEFLRAVVRSAELADDPAARDAAIAAIKAKYAAVAPSTRHLDQRFQRLKAREQEILRAAEGRTHFPNGLSREEFLRQELDAALAEAYSERD